MGILTDTKQRQKFLNLIRKFEKKICFLCYTAGVIWFVALAYKPFNAGVYFSENALLAGLVDHEFYGQGDVSTYYSDLQKKLKDSPTALPKDWIYEKFREIGLDTYYHNFSIKYPMAVFGNQGIPGQNVYAILRAPRTASTEGIVMTAPMRRKTGSIPQSTGGIALMLALAKYFKQKTYWAKDIIFVTTDQELIGMQAWLDAYHGTQYSDYIIPDDLQARSGQIQAAINLEIPRDKINYLNIKTEGLNGQLPNLDLINLVVRICQKENIRPALHHRHDHHDEESSDGFIHSLGTMVRMMWSQAGGTPTGNHGLFFRYHIEAVTLEGNKPNKKSYKYGLDSTGRVVEGIFRSLNNLIERFHQSFFFYFLPSTHRYVSIGLYMPPFGLIVAAALIKAIALWIGEDKDDQKEKDTKEEKTDVKDEGAESDDGDLFEETKPSRLVSILPVVILGMMLSLLAYMSPEITTSVTHRFKMRTDEALIFGFLALACVAVWFPRMLQKKGDHDKVYIDWQLLKCITLIFYSLVLFSVALMNISLAFFLSVITIPVAVIITPVSSKILAWVQRIILMFVSPFSMMYFSAMLSLLVQKQPYDNILDLVVKSWNSMSEGVYICVVDTYFFGSWLFTLFSFAIFPTWVMLWGVLHADP